MKSSHMFVLMLSVWMVSMLALRAAPDSYAQDCITVNAERNDNDHQSIQLRLSNAKGCTPVYGLYVQMERNGSIQGITYAPPGWTYGGSDATAFWIADSERVDGGSKVFGIKVHDPRSFTFHWIALDQMLSPIKEGKLIG